MYRLILEKGSKLKKKFQTDGRAEKKTPEKNSFIERDRNIN